MWSIGLLSHNYTFHTNDNKIYLSILIYKENSFVKLILANEKGPRLMILYLLLLLPDTLEKEMRCLFDIADEKEVRLWNRYMTSTYEHLNKPDNTLQDAGLYHGQVCATFYK